MVRFEDALDKPAFTVVRLRDLAREAGVGSVVAPAPVRLDSLGQELIEMRRRVAALPKVSEVMRRLSARAKAN